MTQTRAMSRVLLRHLLTSLLVTLLALPATAVVGNAAPVTLDTGARASARGVPDTPAVRRAERRVKRAWRAIATCRRGPAGPPRTRCLKRARTRLATAKRGLRTARAKQRRVRAAARTTCQAQGRIWRNARCRPLPANPGQRTGVTALGGGRAGAAQYTWPAYRQARASGVTRLQVPVQVSADHEVWVHPTARVGVSCQNGAPARQGDPEYPYVGKLIRDLDTPQLETLECGTRGAATTAAVGSRMLRLSQLLTHSEALGPGVGYDLEIEHDPTMAGQQWPVATLVGDVSAAVGARVAPERVAVLSADWAVPVAAAADPLLARADRLGIDRGSNLAAGRPAGSPWLAGQDVDAHATGAVGVATRLGLHGISTSSWVAGARYLTPGSVRAGQRAGLLMDGRAGTEPYSARNLVLAGVDRVLTDRPDLARDTWAALGEPRPAPVAVPSLGVTPLTRAHSHNDYVHTRPLLDALELGFQSAEADVYLIDGELRVGHSVAETRPGRTLESLYLAPLGARVRDGSILGRGVPFHLLVEVKMPTAAERTAHSSLTFASSSTTTWQAIEAALAAPPGLITQYEPLQSAPVQVTMTGARPQAAILATAPRHAGVDGSIGDAASGSGFTPEQMTLLSEGDYLGWDGTAPMGLDYQEKMFGRVATAHAGGFRFRWYGLGLTSTPTSRVALWAALYDLGYDYLNIDDLELGATFFRNRALT